MTMPDDRPTPRWRRGLCALAACALALPLAGCFGKFNATRGVHDFNERVSQGAWQRSATFAALNVVPVYPVAALMDALVLNPVEFWTGRNPVEPEDVRSVPRNVTEGTPDLPGNPGLPGNPEKRGNPENVPGNPENSENPENGSETDGAHAGLG